MIKQAENTLVSIIDRIVNHSEIPLVSLIFLVIFFISLFFLIRMIRCWYWRINDFINEMREMNSWFSEFYEQKERELEILDRKNSICKEDSINK